jgi:hypothetical protein
MQEQFGSAIWTFGGGCAKTSGMTQPPPPDTDRTAPRPARPGSGRDGGRDDPRASRLKAALKANLARRKAQGRARSAEGPVTEPDHD